MTATEYDRDGERLEAQARADEARATLTNDDERFFFDHAGYSYDTKTETPEEGRVRGAQWLAKAEADGKRLGYTVTWDDDWDVGSHVKFYGRDAYHKEPDRCEYAVLTDEDGEVLASLGCVDDADADYRRVVEAELALDALGGIYAAIVIDIQRDLATTDPQGLH